MSSFHSNECFNNNYLLDSDQEDPFSSCKNLEFNTELKGILKRSQIDDICSLNHDLLSYNQLKRLLDHKNGQIDNFRLEVLNLKRNHLTLLNRTSDYKRLMVFISFNDIPRIKQLIKSCLNSKVSVEAIIEKLHLAINGKILKMKISF